MSTSQPMNWRNSLLPFNSSLRQVLENLAQVGTQLVIIVDKEGRLIGTINDGDIRRAMLRGLTYESEIDTLIEKAPVVVSPQTSDRIIIKIMIQKKIKQILIVDSDNLVIGLRTWDEFAFNKDFSNKFIIMAGGRGARLKPYTDTVPKPMLKVGNRPILQYIIEKARSEGFVDFKICINYLGHQIEKYFGDGSNFDVNIEYIREDTALGTAGALTLFNDTPDTPVIVTNGDVLTDVRYSDILEYHNNHKADLTMAVRIHERQSPFGVVHLNDIEIINIVEKPKIIEFINAGVYVIGPIAFAYMLPNTYIDMPDLYKLLIENGKKVIAFQVHEPWVDVGTHKEYEAVRDNEKFTK